MADGDSADAEYPTFSKIATFVENKVRILTSLYARSSRSESKGTTVVPTRKAMIRAVESNSEEKPACGFCQLEHHSTSQCGKLM